MVQLFGISSMNFHGCLCEIWTCVRTWLRRAHTLRISLQTFKQTSTFCSSGDKSVLCLITKLGRLITNIFILLLRYLKTTSPIENVKKSYNFVFDMSCAQATHVTFKSFSLLSRRKQSQFCLKICSNLFFSLRVSVSD